MRNYFLIAFIFLYVNVGAQSHEPVQVIPPSPEAAAITKYGLYPVSQFTGIPGISIPLYSITAGNLKIPISLDYHASGIKVDDYASSVGLAWILNAGGAITRTVMGVPDNDPGKGIFVNPPKREHEITGSFANYEYFYNIAQNDLDSEPDIFSFNFCGRSGKFFFKPNKEALTVSYENLLIEWQTNGDFKITDESGNVFLFEEKLTSSSYVNSGSPKYWPVTAWYLTSIQPANTSEIVTLTYESPTSFTLRSHSQMYNLGFRPEPTCHTTIEGVFCFYYHVDVYETVDNTTFLNTQYKHVKQISFKSGTVDFIYQNSILDYPQRVLDSVIVKNKSGQGIKKYSLSHDYFFADFGYNPYAYGNDKSRLKLTGVEEISIDNSNDKLAHEFVYEETIQLPPRKNFGIDDWGYYNGASSNNTLITLDDLGNQYTHMSMGASGKITSNIVPGVRTSSETHMKAGMLKRIKYPTGGYTDFEFEPNEYMKFKRVDIGSIHNVFASIDDPVPPVRVKAFTIPSGPDVSNIAKLTLNIPEWNSANKPSVVLKNVTTGAFTEYKTFSGDPKFRTINVTVVLGHDYELKAHVDIDPNDPNQDPDLMNVTANLKIHHISQTEVAEKGGGLRVKSISSYTGTGSLAKKESYKYGVEEDGIGKMSFYPFLFSKKTYEQVYASYANTLCPWGSSMLHIMDRPFYNASDFGGSKIAYPYVTKYEEGASTTNGKTSYQYEFEMDERAESDFPDPMTLVDMTWKSGQLLSEKKYKRLSSGVYDLVHEVSNTYTPFYKDEMYALKVGNRKVWTVPTYPVQATFPNCFENLYDDFYYFEYPIYSAAKKLTKSVETTYSAEASNDPIVVETDYYYDNPATMLQSRVVSVNSKGETKRTIYKYPHDFSTQAPYNEMVNNRHIWSPVVEQQTYKGTSELLTSFRTNYNFWDAGVWGTNSGTSIIVPQTIETKTLENSWDERLKFLSYNGNGSLLEQQKTADLVASYIWDYDDTYPIAEVRNASAARIAYTSFEASGKGGWQFSGTPGIDYSAPTGRKAYTIVNSANNITKTGLGTGVTYIVSYWKKSGTVTVNGSAPILTGVTLNGWTYLEHRIVNPAGGTITVTGANSVIDELRLYPSDAQMTTSTYDPLIGITSQCDVNNRLVYYKYDGFQRLLLQLDQDKNVLNRFCYKYNGQVGDCDLFGNQVQSGVFSRSCNNPCQVGSSVSYSVPANTYYSTSQAAANALATNDVNTNGQAFANANGTCSTPSNTTVYASNTTSSDVVVVFTRLCDNTGYTFNVGANIGGTTTSGGVTLGSIPIGMYRISFSRSGGSGSHRYRMNSTSTTGTDFAELNNVTVPVSTNNRIMITPP